MLRAVAAHAPAIRVFYSVGGEPLPAEMHQVGEMAGYRGSTPVHFGNAAASQLQLGAYGDLFSAVGKFAERGGRLDAGTSEMLGHMADHTCSVWQAKDAGLWELGDPQRYTSSKIGSWTALHWAVRLAEQGQLSGLTVERWRMERDAIRAWTDRHCWSATKQSYTFYAGTEDLDAATLLVARTGFCAGDDPHLHTTIDAIRRELTADGPLLYRYTGMRGEEGAFLACTGWLVEALVHAGRAQEARTVFEGLVERTNDVGLLSEEMDPVSGELLGNMPQALTHLAVINAATTLSSALRDA